MKRQKKEAEANYHKNGVLEGQAWARNAHYIDLKYAAVSFDSEEAFDGMGHWNGILDDAILGEYFKEVLRERPELASNDGCGEIMVADEGYQFWEGWFEAVRTFWEEVASALKD